MQNDEILTIYTKCYYIIHRSQNTNLKKYINTNKESSIKWFDYSIFSYILEHIINIFILLSLI